MEALVLKDIISEIKKKIHWIGLPTNQAPQKKRKIKEEEVQQREKKRQVKTK